MAKMHFKYACMNSGKSIDLLRTAHNYEENGYNVLVLKPKIDTKDNDSISSRIGLKRKVDYLVDDGDNVLDKLKGKLSNINCIFVDEAQFLKEKQVDDFFIISKVYNIPVICYGLRTNFMLNSFEGSKRLLEVCDILEELTTLCSCGKIARYTARMKDNEYLDTGDEVIIDGDANYTYRSLCGDCYLKKVKKIDYEKIKKSHR